MAGNATDWAAVLDGLLASDRIAFAELNRLITTTLAQLRAWDFRDEWDDLRQEVLLALVASARAGRLRDPRALVGYVRIVTRNKFMDRLKRHLRHQEDAHLPWDEQTADGFALPPEHAAMHDLGVALGALTQEERRVVEGIFGDGKTYQEVSDEAGLPLGTMKRRLRTAMAALRRRVAGGTE
jgi:RNA polymerase sigma-70 factor (ECF subfamily)